VEFLTDLSAGLKGEVSDNMTTGNTLQLFTTINGLCNFAEQSIDDYRNNRLTLDRLQFLISSRIIQALVLWAYTIPAVGVVGAVTEKYKEIEKLEDFAVISENIQRIHSVVQELYEKRKEYLPSLINKIALEIELIIKKCGLTFTDLPNGSSYIRVQDPSFLG
jgi:hypothetical protein